MKMIPLIFSDLICAAIIVYVWIRMYLNPMVEKRAVRLFHRIGTALIATVVLDHIWEFLFENASPSALLLSLLNVITTIEFFCVPLSFFFLLVYHRAKWDWLDTIMLAADLCLIVLGLVNLRIPVLYGTDAYGDLVNVQGTAICYLGSLILFGCILIHDFVTVENLDVENWVLILFNLLIAGLGTAGLYFDRDVISVWECYSISFLLLHSALVRLFAKTDQVTGLPNRNAFTVSYFRKKRRQVPVLVSFDLNHLKHYNDSQGHRSGDLYLRAFAQTARKYLCPYGRLYRTGGDEFCFTSYADPAQVQKALDDLQKLGVCDPAYGRYPLDFAYGMVVRQPGETNEALYQRADEMMYQNKREAEK